MKIRITLLSILFGVALVACKDDADVRPRDADYVIIGIYGVYCGGDCDRFYLITEDQLFADTDYNPPFEDAVFSDFSLDHELSHEKHQLVDDTYDILPAELFTLNHPVLGEPDISDVGDTYIEVRTNGERRHWILRNGDFDMEEPFRSLQQAINERIHAIEN